MLGAKFGGGLLVAKPETRLLMRKVFWGLFAVMITVYLTMLLWTFPHLTALSGGLPMFDMRPTGYTFAEARAVLTAIGTDGSMFYLNVQQPLDSVYPALLGVVLIMSFFRLFQRRVAYVLSAMSIMAVGFDYLENAAVSVMLHAGAEGVSEAMVATANRWTLLKSGFVSIALTALLIGLIMWSWRKWRKR